MLNNYKETIKVKVFEARIQKPLHRHDPHSVTLQPARSVCYFVCLRAYKVGVPIYLESLV